MANEPREDFANKFQDSNHGFVGIVEKIDKHAKFLFCFHLFITIVLFIFIEISGILKILYFEITRTVAACLENLL